MSLRSLAKRYLVRTSGHQSVAWHWTSLLTRINGLVRDLGWKDALLYCVARVVSVVSFGRARLLKYTLTAQPILDKDVTPARRGRSIAVHEATPTEIRATDFGRPADVIEARLRLGCRCLVAHVDGRLVGFQWFTIRDYMEDEVRCRFVLAPADHCAWDFDIYVVPEARMLPVFLRLWDRCNRLLREDAVSLSLSRINAFNSSSVRAHLRLGAQPIGSAVFLTVGRLQLAVLPTFPWAHISSASGRVPRLQISRLARQRA